MVPLKRPLFDDDYSHIILDNNDEILRVYLNNNEQWIIPIEFQQEIPRKLELSILTFEDRFFHYHIGINPFSIVKAWRLNQKAGRIISGASTITMQLARMSTPKERSYKHKILEMLQAIKIEMIYSKEDILGQYITHAPFGNNIQGFYAASFFYFNRSPEDLTWAEAALLAVLPNAPSTINILSNNDQLNDKRNQLLNRMYLRGFLTQSEYELALLEPIPQKIHLFDIVAPHLSDHIRQNNRDKYIHRTTINKDIQLDVESLIGLKAKELLGYGIKNVSALIANTKTGEIISYIGSADYFNYDHNGPVNGVLAWRSPGSTLKPFLYALAIDKGMALPDTKLFDIPTNINGFTPMNANESYYGVVSMKQALIESLNIPATRVLNGVGLNEFYYFLKSAGIKTLFRSPEEYGLSIILGGSEVTMMDLASLYRGLGNYGSFSDLYYLRNHEKANTQQLISPGAAYLTLEMMNELVRPGTEYFWNIFSSQSPISWKTGTSYGQRDSWAIGVSPEYTIAVWAGNFTGEGNASISGVKTAGPILFDIFNRLPKSNYNKRFIKPKDDLIPVTICADTGRKLGKYCLNSKKVSAPKEALPLQTCPYHYQLHLNKEKTHQVCSLCWLTDSKLTESRLIYPPEVRKILIGNGQIVDFIPIHNPDHIGYQSQHSMSWVYPKQSSMIWIPRDETGNLQKIPCKVAHIRQESRVFWFLNNQYVGHTEKIHEIPIIFEDGINTLLAIDEHGTESMITFTAAIKKP